ncbi:MAG: hypothetical protein JNL58_30085 [Planctomyces sp.]|nr:hypothetical protein [Planctomyces sp.]
MNSADQWTIMVIMQGEDSVHEKQSESVSPPRNAPRIWDQFKSSVEKTGLAKVLLLKDEIQMELNLDVGSYMKQFHEMLDRTQPDWLVAFWTHEHRWAGKTGNLFLELGYYISRCSDRQYSLIARPTVVIPDLATSLGVTIASTGEQAAAEVLDAMAEALGSTKGLPS